MASRHFLAFPRGFEHPTYRLGGGRSILLSYGNIYRAPPKSSPASGGGIAAEDGVDYPKYTKHSLHSFVFAPHFSARLPDAKIL